MESLIKVDRLEGPCLAQTLANLVDAARRSNVLCSIGASPPVRSFKAEGRKPSGKSDAALRLTG
jgi:hypothetical protein